MHSDLTELFLQKKSFSLDHFQMTHKSLVIIIYHKWLLASWKAQLKLVWGNQLESVLLLAKKPTTFKKFLLLFLDLQNLTVTSSSFSCHMLT